MEAVRLPFLEPILPEGVARGRTIGVFFSPDSEWQLIVTAIVASRIQAGLRAGIVTTTRFPKEIYEDVARFGVQIERALKEGMFHVADWYTCLTGSIPREPPEDMPRSLTVSDLGLVSYKLWHLREEKRPESDPGFIEFALFDNLARLFNYNEHNLCIKFLSTMIARMKHDTRVGICGFASGMLERGVYANLESMFDGILDVTTAESRGVTITIVRVRSFPHVQHTKGWQAVRAQPNSVALVPVSDLGEDLYRAARAIGTSQAN